MDTRDQSLYERWGPRRAKQALVLLAALSLMIILSVVTFLELDALRGERRIQALAIGVLALMALLLWFRIVRNRWLLLQIQTFTASATAEETGVWGVGGPGMRTPGATGIYEMPPRGEKKNS